jgi:hypothetical protein
MSIMKSNRRAIVKAIATAGGISIISACALDSSASRAEVETLETLDFGSLEYRKS